MKKIAMALIMIGFVLFGLVGIAAFCIGLYCAVQASLQFPILWMFTIFLIAIPCIGVGAFLSLDE